VGVATRMMWVKYLNQGNGGSQRSKQGHRPGRRIGALSERAILELAIQKLEFDFLNRQNSHIKANRFDFASDAADLCNGSSFLPKPIAPQSDEVWP
jgi:hypothetical protein